MVQKERRNNLHTCSKPNDACVKDLSLDMIDKKGTMSVSILNHVVICHRRMNTKY